MPDVSASQQPAGVPSTNDFVRSMFMEMINTVRSHDHLIVEAIQNSEDGRLTEEEIVEYMGENIDGFFFGKYPDWWTVCDVIIMIFNDIRSCL